MAYFGPTASSTLPHMSSYKSVASDEIELKGDTHSQIHHSTCDVRGHTDQNRYVQRETLQNTTWEGLKAVARRCFSHTLPIFTILGLIVLLAKMSHSGWIEANYSVCQPDGTFSLSFDQYTPWKQDSFFAIDMSYGSYSYGTAKLIDVVWDVVRINSLP